MAKGFSMLIFSTYGFCHAVPRVFQSIRVEFRAHSWCLCADLKATIVKQCLKMFEASFVLHSLFRGIFGWLVSCTVFARCNIYQAPRKTRNFGSSIKTT